MLSEADINWSDPVQRYELLNRIGPAAYNKAVLEHRKAAVIETVNGYAIRPVNTRFGLLFEVGDTGTAMDILAKARSYAKRQPRGKASK